MLTPIWLHLLRISKCTFGVYDLECVYLTLKRKFDNYELIFIGAPGYRLWTIYVNSMNYIKIYIYINSHHKYIINDNIRIVTNFHLTPWLNVFKDAYVVETTDAEVGFVKGLKSLKHFGNNEEIQTTWGASRRFWYERCR